MMKYYLSVLFLFCSAVMYGQQNVSYVPEDSVRIVQLLREGAKAPADEPLTLWFARQFMNRPYVAHTLEVKGEEHLAVNLQSLDCTTLVENVCALTLTVRHGGTTFRDFCHWLCQLRYADGKLNGYSSRNHYFSQWVQSGERLGLIREVTSDAKASFAALTKPMKLTLNYMSVHPDAYPLLKVDAAERKLIAEMERQASGGTVCYITAENVGRGKADLGDIHDGDILALTTSKAGLDVSHLGFSVWGKDGKLHLLNASSIHHKVVLEPMTLRQYMQKHPSQTGIRVVRLR